MCNKFLIYARFNEIAILNVCEDLENKEIDLNLAIENAKIQSKIGRNAFFKNGCQGIESCFILQCEETIDNEDFMFSSFGKKLNVNLSTEMMDTKSSKKRKNSEVFKKEVISRGEIDLLQIFQRNEEKSFVLMEIYNNMEIALSFEITFENLPKIASVLSIQIDNFYNFNVCQDSSIEACIRFPYEENFRAAMMEKSKNCQEPSSLYLMDGMLEEINFEINSSIPSKMEIGYKNYQTELGLNFFHMLIEKKQNLLIEFRIDGKMMMAFLDLDVFNFPGVNDIKLITPLYHWKKSIIRELFQQEASLKDEKLLDKKGKKISTKRKTVESEEESSLIPIMVDDKHAAISVRINFSNPRNTNECIEDLTLHLNEKFQFIDNESLVEKTLKENNENFKLVIEEITRDFENFLNNNPEISEMEIKSKMELIFDKNKLKDIVKVLIGNVYNYQKRTATNHEFKILMMEVFKSLNEKIVKILNDKWIEDKKVRETLMDDELMIDQIEEWLALKNKSKVDEILTRQLKNDSKSLNKLEILAFYQFKLEYFIECEETIMKILKIDHFNVLGLYLLSYLAYERDNIDAAIISVKILQKLIPDSMEFLMILKSFYDKIKFTAGEKFCNIYLRESKFIPTYNLAESNLYPQVKSNNSVINIMHQQLKFKFHKFLKITKNFLQVSVEDFEVKTFDIIEALEAFKVNSALSILKSIEIQDDNEITLRILKGNLLFLMHDQWRAICEYEIVYNLCLKSKVKLPHMPALRCARWYLHEVKNTTKARRYFHYCCKNFATFNSFNEFGIVNLLEMSYKNAEKYFNRANQIHRNCGETWINLAFVNCKLDNIDIALKCYMTAKNCGVKESEILYSVERELKI